MISFYNCVDGNSGLGGWMFSVILAVNDEDISSYHCNEIFLRHMDAVNQHVTSI